MPPIWQLSNHEECSQMVLTSLLKLPLKYNCCHAFAATPQLNVLKPVLCPCLQADKKEGKTSIKIISELVLISFS